MLAMSATYTINSRIKVWSISKEIETVQKKVGICKSKNIDHFSIDLCGTAFALFAIVIKYLLIVFFF